MKKLSMILGAIALAVSGAALAGGPEQVYQAQAPQASNNGFYVGVLGGVAIPSNVKHNQIKTGYNTGGLVGYKYGDFRFEGDADYTNNALGKNVLPTKAHYNIVTVMGNAIYDINLNSPFVPFVGAGVGYARVWVSQPGSVSNTSTKGVNRFAYQGIAGLGYTVTKNITANVTYKFRAFSNLGGLHQNLITAGLNYNFA